MSQAVHRTVYEKEELTGDGAFIRFTITADKAHDEHGCWRFNVEGNGEDDLRAYRLGFHCPEHLLAAVIHDDEPSKKHDEIILRWDPGTLDTFRHPRVGTAAQHIAYISEERMLLGLPTSFQGQVPTYSTDPKKRLLNHRIKAHNIKTHEQANSSPEFSQVNEQSLTGTFSTPRLSVNRPQLPAQLTQTSPTLEKNTLNVSLPPRSLVDYPYGVSPSQLPRKPRKQATTRASTDSTQPAPDMQAVAIEASTKSQDQYSYGVASNIKQPLAGGFSLHSNEYSQANENQTRRLPSSISSAQETVSAMTYISPYDSPDNSTSPNPLPPISPLTSPQSSLASQVHCPSTSGLFNSLTAEDSGVMKRGLRTDRNICHEHGSSTLSSTAPVQEPLQPPTIGEPISTSGYSSSNNSSGSDPNPARSTSTKNLIPSNLIANDSSRPVVSEPVTCAKNRTSMHVRPIKKTQDQLTGSHAHISSSHTSVSSANKVGVHRRKDCNQKETSVSKRNLSGGDMDWLPLDVPLYEAHYDHEDPFITDLLPLSEAIPCMDCGNAEHHSSECSIANFQPRKNLNMLEIRRMADFVNIIDPEKWRRHWNFPPTSDLEPIEEKLSGVAELIKADKSFLNDPDLQNLPDNAMLLLWAMKTSKGTQIIHQNGEFIPSPSENIWENEAESGNTE